VAGVAGWFISSGCAGGRDAPAAARVLSRLARISLSQHRRAVSLEDTVGSCVSPFKRCFPLSALPRE